MTTVAQKKAQESRPKRTPLGKRNRLTFSGLDKNYSYRVINDQDDRIQMALEAGYEFVVSDEKLGDTRVAEGTSTDSRVSKPVGHGTKGYLMRIPKEYYDQDQAEKAVRVDATEQAMDAKKDGEDHYGKGLTSD